MVGKNAEIVYSGIKRRDTINHPAFDKNQKNSLIRSRIKSNQENEYKIRKPEGFIDFIYSTFDNFAQLSSLSRNLIKVDCDYSFYCS
jgi:hypothetical protein